MHLPSTRTLQAFVTTARLGSLAAASARSAMSVPTLSRRLAGLEKDLGVRLFERVPRGLVLTAAGNNYLVHAVAVLDRLQVAAGELGKDATTVRVTTIPAFATRWLLPRLPGFSARHPGIEVDVRTSISFERIDASQYDFGIRLALDREMAIEPLLPIHLMPVWSVAHPRLIKHPDDVLNHPLLGPDHRPEFWQEWFCGVGLKGQKARPREIDSLLLYERALSGAGVAIGIEPLTSALVREGRLNALTTHRVRSARSFFLVEPAEIRTRAARLFRGWLQGETQG
tara:strand:- start:10696 stop:11547 length:852 start_codon:yes stop_codon:yes gene_type:complete